MHERIEHQTTNVGKTLRIYGAPALIGALILGIVACGGDSGTLAGGGIGGTGIISVGAITELGSIFVNDIEFATDMAAVTLDGMPADETLTTEYQYF